MSLVEVSQSDGLAEIVLNRPEKLNAVNSEMLVDIHDALARLDADPSCNVIMISGKGRSFCAGRDLADVARFHGADATSVLEGMKQVNAVFEIFEWITTPTVAAVQGHTLGFGFSLALLSDITVADETTRFGLPEVTRGIAAFGPVPGLLRSAPYKAAVDLLLTGDIVPAERAYALGLVTRLAPAGEATARAREVAGRLALVDKEFSRETKSNIALSLSVPANSIQGHLTRLSAFHHLQGGAAQSLKDFDK